LKSSEIEAFVKGASSGAIPNYQVAAWLMAVYFRGMDQEETMSLTASDVG